MPPSKAKEWRTLPGSRKLYKWSDTRNAYIYEDGSIVPETSATRANLQLPSQSGLRSRTVEERSSRPAQAERDDPDLSMERWRASRNQTERPLNGEPDTRGFRVRGAPREDFRFGQVFETPVALASEPRASGSSDVTALPVNHSGQVEVQRFVVISPATNTASDGFKAVRISTYGGLGVAAEGVLKHHHAIIYTSKSPPECTREELPRRLRGGGSEGPMLTRPILVKPRPGVALHSMARLNLGVIHHFDVDVYVRKFGNVVEDDFEDLRVQFLHVWRDKQRFASHRHTAAQSVANLEALTGSRVNNPNNDAALPRAIRPGAQLSSRPEPGPAAEELTRYGSAPSAQSSAQYFIPGQGSHRVDSRNEEDIPGSTLDFTRKMDQMHLGPPQQSSAAISRLTQEQQRQSQSNATRQQNTAYQGQDSVAMSRASMIGSAAPSRGATRDPRSGTAQGQSRPQQQRTADAATTEDDVYDNMLEFSQRLNQRRQIAAQRRLPLPPPLTTQQQQTLANNITLQQQYFRNLDVQWESILNRRRDNAGQGRTATDSDDYDDDDDDDDSVVDERTRGGRRR